MDKANAILLMVGIKFADLIEGANTTIKEQPKMVQGGLTEHGTAIAASKKKMTDVYTEEDKKKAAISDIEGLDDATASSGSGTAGTTGTTGTTGH